MATRIFRLFVICVIIVTSIIESPIRAFTIRRNTEPVERVDDLVAAESSMYEARTDKSRSNNIRTINYNQGGQLEKVLPALTSAKVIEIKGDPSVDDKVELTTAFLLLRTDQGLFKITGLPIYTSGTSSLPSQIPTDLPVDTTEFLRERKEKAKRNDTNTNDSIPTTIQAIKLNSPETTTSEIEPTEEIKTIEGPVTTSIATISTDENVKKTDATTFTTTDLTQTTIPLDTIIPLDTTIPLYTSTLTKREKQISSHDETLGNTSGTTSDAFTFASVSPPWKKYTTIDRKRLGSQNTQITINSETTREMDTEPTRVSLEKLLSESPKPSLEKLGDDLLSGFNTTETTIQSKLEVSSLPVAKETDGSAPTSSEFISSSVTKPTSLKTLHLTSMRAGFLDYSAKPIAEEATTIIENFDTVSKFTGSELIPTSLAVENKRYNTTPESKKYTGVKSQSQLAEDAMKELMQQETFSDKAKNNRFRKEGNGEVKLIKTEVGSDKTTVSDFVLSGRDTPGEDLKVKPIDKNSTVYTVSSVNYKPPKKIDVQSLKPVVRNPDDNSWRNESISSLGIVFKAKPPSKNYTQVLKTKSETLFNNSVERYNKNETPDLRERLEKIAEVRKSKKKKVIDKFGDTVYSDYEENVNSAETTSASSPVLETTSAIIPREEIITKYLVTNDPVVTTYTSLLDHIYGHKIKESTTTPKPKKYSNILEYYDATDDYDTEYINLPKIDLKKFTSRLTTKDTPIAVPVLTSQFTKPTTNHWPDRKPTLQYFPPLNTQKESVNDYDNDFGKINFYTYKNTKNTNPDTHTTIPTPPESHKYEHYKQNTIKPAEFTRLYRPANVENNGYAAHQQRPPADAQENAGYVDANDGSYDKASYVIKHYKDFIDVAAKDADYDKNIEYERDAYTRQPLKGITLDELGRAKNQNKQSIGVDYDYDEQFRKDILNRFVDNFNQNSERFKVDFPILYNNSVVHRAPEESGKAIATSSAFLKRLYDEQSNANTATKTNDYLIQRPCDHCDNFTVELSPAYELHYYVPDQEEKEEADPRATIPYRFGL